MQGGYCACEFPNRPRIFLKFPFLLAFFTPQYGVSIYIVFVSGLSNTFPLFFLCQYKNSDWQGYKKWVYTPTQELNDKILNRYKVQFNSTIFWLSANWMDHMDSRCLIHLQIISGSKFELIAFLIIIHHTPSHFINKWIKHVSPVELHLMIYTNPTKTSMEAIIVFRTQT